MPESCDRFITRSETPVYRGLDRNRAYITIQEANGEIRQQAVPVGNQRLDVVLSCSSAAVSKLVRLQVLSKV